MSQSLHWLYVHIIFSTKNREPILNNEHRPCLYAYMAGILRNFECHSITIGGIEDHVHIGCALTKKHAPMKVIEILKKDSSRCLKSKSPIFREFQWQEGYGLFSISPSHIEQLEGYILNQVSHHQKTTFKEEYLNILKKYGSNYQEEYLWK